MSSAVYHSSHYDSVLHAVSSCIGPAVVTGESRSNRVCILRILLQQVRAPTSHRMRCALCPRLGTRRASCRRHGGTHLLLPLLIAHLPNSLVVQQRPRCAGKRSSSSPYVLKPIPSLYLADAYHRSGAAARAQTILGIVKDDNPRAVCRASLRCEMYGDERTTVRVTRDSVCAT